MKSSKQRRSPGASNDQPWQPPDGLPVRRQETGRWWHHAHPDGRFFVIPDIATTTGRGHIEGGPGVWYASDSLAAVVAEVARSFVDPSEFDSNLVERQFGSVIVSLEVLDASDNGILEFLGISRHQLVGDNRRLPQQLVSYALSLGLQGVIIPSAAMIEGRTLVVLRGGERSVHVESTIVSSCNLAELEAKFVPSRLNR